MGVKIPSKGFALVINHSFQKVAALVCRSHIARQKGILLKGAKISQKLLRHAASSSARFGAVAAA
jgi:hypothetical protein